MDILVTGGTGFVGSNLAKELIKEGHKVTITGTDAEQRVQGAAKYLHPGFLGLNWSKLGAFDIVYHQAAINDTTNMDRDEMIRNNYEASKQLIEQTVAAGCKRIVYASSTAVYGDVAAPYHEDGPTNPLNPYAESKLLLDEWTMDFAQKHPDVTIVGLRYCNVYGPGEEHKGRRASMIYQLAKQMSTGNPQLFKNGEQLRDYIYVKDVVTANLCAAQAKESCVVNCGAGEATSYNDIVGLLNAALMVQRSPEYIDNPYADRYQEHTKCDMSLAKEKIGFAPQWPLVKGIPDYINTLKPAP